jgi:cytochrome P450
VATQRQTLPPFDPFNPEHHAEPEERLAAARRCPIYEPRAGVAVVARYTDVHAALAEPDRFSSHGNFALEGEVPMPVPMITTTDPPAHSELRGRLRRWFAPAQLRKHEPRVREIVAAALAELPAAGDVELYSALIERIPGRVVFSFLGLPAEDWTEVQEWTDRVAETLPNVDPQQPEFRLLLGYLTRLVQRRTTQPPSGEDVIDGLVHPATEEPPLSPTEIVSHVLQLVMAATDTTRSAMTNTLYRLLVEPHNWERIGQDRALIPLAIDESLRRDAPLQYVLRTARSEAELSGCPITEGNKVLLSLQSANWDESVWGSDAMQFALDRDRSTSHLSFGYGIHTCLGAPLARIEVRVLIEGLLDRYPRLRLAEGYEWQKIPGDMLRRPARLTVALG